MGGSPVRFIKRAGRAVQKTIGEQFEELIEKPTKKIARETVDTVTGMDKYDRGSPETPEITPEVTPEVVPDDETITTRYATRRTKRSGQAGTIIEGYGVVQRPKSEKAIT